MVAAAFLQIFKELPRHVFVMWWIGRKCYRRHGQKKLYWMGM